MKSFVVDTNVAVVASRRSPQAGPACVLACVDVLEQIAKSGRIVLDDKSRILDEYMRNLSLSGQPGLGDAFFKWVWQNQANTARCERVVIHPKPGLEEDYTEFPADAELRRFDRSDRKFVAVAMGSRYATEILNAVDRHWWDYRISLERYGLRITFLCPGQFGEDRSSAYSPRS